MEFMGSARRGRGGDVAERTASKQPRDIEPAPSKSGTGLEQCLCLVALSSSGQHQLAFQAFYSNLKLFLGQLQSDVLDVKIDEWKLKSGGEGLVPLSVDPVSHGSSSAFEALHPPFEFYSSSPPRSSAVGQQSLLVGLNDIGSSIDQAVNYGIVHRCSQR